VTTTPPCYVYCALLMNYRSADQWHIVAASPAPLQAVRHIRNAAINVHAVTRKVLWCVECQDAAGVAVRVNDWLREMKQDESGGCYKLAGVTVEDVLAKAKFFCAGA
jgi:mannose-6-phosphate isomerase class I